MEENNETTPTTPTTPTSPTTKTTKKSTLAERMNSTRVLITNLNADESLKARVLEFGFDEESLTFGKTKYDEAILAIQKKDELYGEFYKVTERLNEKAVEAFGIHREDLTLAKRALRGLPDLKDKLGIKKSSARSFAQRIKDARRFYLTATADTEILDKLTKFNLTLEKLQNHLTLIEEIETLDALQEDLRGKAQIATKERDLVLKELFDWASDLVAVCRIAFKAEIQTLERLGIMIPS